MKRPYVERMRIENYGCVTDVEVGLTPIHALIGPNDSGKSTILGALGTLASLGLKVPQSEMSRLDSSRGLSRVHLSASTQGQSFHFETDAASARQAVVVGDSPVAWHALGVMQVGPPLSIALGGSTTLRLDPDVLRKNSYLIQAGSPIALASDRGDGLPGVYDAILSRNYKAYVALNERVTKLFPNVKTLRFDNPNNQTKSIACTLINGQDVSASTMSEGLLYFLAFAALKYMDNNAILLVEEPENGLHPARIADVMSVLREVAETTQVLIATHSPFVINELKPDEVSVVTRDKDVGTKVTRIDHTPKFKERSEVYALGELWVSYANGEDEGPLLNGGPRP